MSKITISKKYYRPTKTDIWSGRIDSTVDAQAFRLHQMVSIVDLTNESQILKIKEIVIIGFCCDEGVSRNKGRVGAYAGPLAIRKSLCSMPTPRIKIGISDWGDVVCDNKNMEAAQKQLSELVSLALSQDKIPLVLGGGHEISYGHYLGVYNFVKAWENIGIINFDAHFDLRPLDDKPGHSGTSFTQIAALESGISYLPIGIRKTGNTPSLFRTASALKVDFMVLDELRNDSGESIIQRISDFINSVDYIYLTVDMDCFASFLAPGVSAPSPIGLTWNEFMIPFKAIMSSGKILCMDIAEMNPKYDINNMTAKLAAEIAWRFIENVDA